MITGKKDIEEVVGELEVLERIEEKIGDLEHKIVDKLALKEKFQTIEEAIKDVFKKHKHQVVEVEGVHYKLQNNTVYVIITLTNSITPITRLSMSEDIKDNLLVTKGEIDQAIVNFYLHGKEDLTDYEISTWEDIKLN